MKDLLRQIPKVDDILKDEKWGDLSVYPEATAKDNLRDILNELRAAIKEGRADSVPAVPAIIEETKRRTARSLSPHLRKVVNGTGVVIHTNLGRSPLPRFAFERLLAVASGYSNLEYNLEEGRRGDRHDHCLSLMTRLTGAEGALIVNNNAAAVLLTLNTFADGKEVIIGRGELIEIGGSFRIPEVMEKSGAVLREVGTTNRTFREDYERAVNERTGLIMKAHTSNYRIRGFVHETTSEELTSLAASRDIPFYFDTGSGLFSPLGNHLGFSEPTIREEVKKNIDLISFSGDKLLGGPQAGIVVGKKGLIDALKKNPLTRALRPDKFTLSALEATLLLYLDLDKARLEIPVLRMLYQDETTLKTRAGRLRRLLQRRAVKATIEVARMYSEVGGGSLPDVSIPSCGLSLQPNDISVERFEQNMRGLPVPVIGRIEKGRFLIDMRTVQEADEPHLLSGIETALRDGR
ncbi:MAG: L-seryl-tRNA(Sec) selenium transferase [Syntrophorhabdaceae bacterium PtaU1.Bin034]|nr:MAG: L-seryl-tRNA(Sec) selenium transferase [Syntrophorhabdaceae bacterium PtaU1.Bin034]